MNLENLAIRRVIVHQFQSAENSLGEIQEIVSGELQQEVDNEIQMELSAKLVELMKSSTYTQEMIVGDAQDGSAFYHISELHGATAQGFESQTASLARSLRSSQSGSAISNCVLIFIEATVGIHSKPSIFVVKADKHNGITNDEVGKMSILKGLFLSGAKRLNKIAAFVQVDGTSSNNPDGWEISLFDGQTKPAAEYFRLGFLGLEVAPTGARFTEMLHKETMTFLDESDMSMEDKAKAARGIQSAIWDSFSEAISPEDISESLVPRQFRDDFLNHLENKGIPTDSFPLDPGRLSRSKSYSLNFSNGIQLKLPWDNIDDHLKISEVEEDDGIWTTIKFKGVRR